MLELRQVTKRFSGIPAVQDVSFTVGPGEIAGYLGPNGSGKSTTLKMITGLIDPTDGDILFAGESTRRHRIAFKQRLGYVPEEPHLYSHLTGFEYLEMVGQLRGLPAGALARKIDGILRVLSLHGYRYVAISSYSKGMRQKVLLAAALLHNPDLLLLDEPFSGLDVNSALVLRSLIRELAVPKYGTSQLPGPVLSVAAWGDEEFLISTTMAVAGLFAVVAWNAVLPDRRDSYVLGPPRFVSAPSSPPSSPPWSPRSA